MVWQHIFLIDYYLPRLIRKGVSESPPTLGDYDRVVGIVTVCMACQSINEGRLIIMVKECKDVSVCVTKTKHHAIATLQNYLGTLYYTTGMTCF